MRAVVLCLGLVAAGSLACGGRLEQAHDRGCTAVCNEAEVHCEAKCPNANPAENACEAACRQAEDTCVSKCQK